MKCHKTPIEELGGPPLDALRVELTGECATNAIDLLMRAYDLMSTLRWTHPLVSETREFLREHKLDGPRP